MLPDTDTLLILAAGVLAFGFVGLLFAAYHLWQSQQQLERRVASVGAAPTGADPAEPVEERGAVRLSRLAGTTLGPGEFEIARLLDRCRLPPEKAPAVYFSVRVALGVLMSLALLRLGFGTALFTSPVKMAGLAVLGLAIGWSLPRIIVERIARNRTRAIANALPEAIELLVIAIEAGLSLEDALKRIVRELRLTEPAIAEELTLTSADLKILPDRDQALQRLAARVPLPSLRSVVTTLVQTLRYGTPLAKALRIVAGELRNDSLLRLEEQANRLPVLLTVPMILFILPSLFLVIGGPAFLHVLDLFTR